MIQCRELCSATSSTLDSVVMQPRPDHSDLIGDKTNYDTSLHWHYTAHSNAYIKALTTELNYSPD